MFVKVKCDLSNQDTFRENDTKESSEVTSIPGKAPEIEPNLIDGKYTHGAEKKINAIGLSSNTTQIQEHEVIGDNNSSASTRHATNGDIELIINDEGRKWTLTRE